MQTRRYCLGLLILVLLGGCGKAVATLAKQGAKKGAKAGAKASAGAGGAAARRGVAAGAVVGSSDDLVRAGAGSADDLGRGAGRVVDGVDALDVADLVIGDDEGDGVAVEAGGKPRLSTEEVTARLAEKPLACPSGTARQQQVDDEKRREVWCARTLGSGESRREGPFRSWRGDGTKEVEGVYRAGVKNGLWRRWYRNGQMAEQCLYQGDVRHGRCETWSVEGQRQKDMEYWNGRPTR